MTGRGSPFDLLPDDVLLAVLASVDERTRLRVLPLVCRRFAAALRRPSDCWRALRFVGRRWPADLTAERHRLLGFLRWAMPRAEGMTELRLDLLPPEPSPDSPELFAPLHVVLWDAAPTLRRLEFKTVFELNCRHLLPAALQARLGRLAELDLLSEDGMRDLNLGGLTALQRLNLVDDRELPVPLDASSILPPSLTWLGLTPAPVADAADGTLASRIPPCVLDLPQLQFLDVSESMSLSGLDSALPRLTLLTGLALDHANLPACPPQLSLLTRLRLLSLHGTLSPVVEEPPTFAPLSALRCLRVLSISECAQLRELPSAVAGLTDLRALHVEKCPLLRTLPPDLTLPKCVMFSMDWRVLLESHQVLAHLTSLQQLLLGSMPLDDVAELADAAAVGASLARCPALRRVSVLVYPDAPLNVQVAGVMLALGRHCLPGLKLEALDANQFFLTDSESLAAEE